MRLCQPVPCGQPECDLCRPRTKRELSVTFLLPALVLLLVALFIIEKHKHPGEHVRTVLTVGDTR